MNGVKRIITKYNSSMEQVVDIIGQKSMKKA